MTFNALSPWQAWQAAMLYRYASLEYLQEYHLILSQIVDGVVDPDLATRSGYEAGREYLIGVQWGPCPLRVFQDLQHSVASDIRERKKGHYKFTSTDQALRKIEELKWQPTEPEEEHQFNMAVEVINHFAGAIDDVFYPLGQRWNDRSFVSRFPRACQNFSVNPGS